jgi:phthalate 4,5-dioxygenase
MLSNADNDKMCRVGPGTPMGSALRQYWMPIATSDEVITDGAPLDVEILGEHYVAFRNSKGEVGILAEQCCHRGVSLVLGRVEDCGLRCIYHGWLFAPDGEVLETPNVQGQEFKKRVRQTAYPVREAGGMIFGYFGKDAPPPFPDLPFFKLPAENRSVFVNVSDGNFIQALEGLLDSTHLGMLHSGNLKKLLAAGKQDARGQVFLQDVAPKFEVEDTDYGLRYAALRQIADGEGGQHTLARVTAWIAPFFILNPSDGISSIPVPVNDEVTAFYHVSWNSKAPLTADKLEGSHALREQYRTRRADYKTADRPNRTNRWHQDRQMMDEGHFSGFEGLIQDDVAMFGSAGGVKNRTTEHLAPSDLAIARLYRRLLGMSDSGAKGEESLGRSVLGDLSHAYAFHAELKPGEDWRTRQRPVAADPVMELEPVE